METRFHLKLQSGPESGLDTLLEKPELFLGRESNNDIVISDPEVSRRHARLVLIGDQYSIEDLGSTNGTFVQGIQIHGLTTLNTGDIITIGERVVLLYETELFDPDATMVTPRVMAQTQVEPSPVTPPFSVPLNEAEAEPEPEILAPEPIPQASVQPTASPVEQASSVEAIQLPPKEEFESTPMYAGKVPAQPPAAKKRSPWRGIILIVVLLILIFCVIPWIIIDITNSYCLFLPGILNAIQPGVCP